MQPPLTKLSEEEELFRDTVRDFAEREVRPRVAAMERASAVDPALLAKCFELGLMGIDIPESHGGAGGNLLMTVLAVEELSAVDASVAIFVDVQNTLVNTLLRKCEVGKKFVAGMHAQRVKDFLHERPVEKIPEFLGEIV